MDIKHKLKLKAYKINLYFKYNIIKTRRDYTKLKITQDIYEKRYAMKIKRGRKKASSEVKGLRKEM